MELADGITNEATCAVEGGESVGEKPTLGPSEPPVPPYRDPAAALDRLMLALHEAEEKRVRAADELRQAGEAMVRSAEWLRLASVDLLVVLETELKCAPAEPADPGGQSE